MKVIKGGGTNWTKSAVRVGGKLDIYDLSRDRPTRGKLFFGTGQMILWPPPFGKWVAMAPVVPFPTPKHVSLLSRRKTVACFELRSMLKMTSIFIFAWRYRSNRIVACEGELGKSLLTHLPIQ